MTAARAKIAGAFSLTKKTTAEAASAAAPTSAIETRKRSRRNRSPSEAAKGATSAAGSMRTSPAMPTPDRPACVVGEDAERDEMRPLGCDRRPPPEFEAPEVLVAEDGNQAGEGLSRSVHPAIESQKPAPNKAA